MSHRRLPIKTGRYTRWVRIARKFAANRPRQLSLLTVSRALVTTAVANRLRTHRDSRLPYPFININEQYVHEARASGRSVIFTSFHSNFAHISQSWFYSTIREESWPIHALTSWGDRPTVRSYSRVFSSVIFTPNEVRKAIQVLRRGEGLVVLQDVLTEDGTPITIFDRVVHLQLGAVRLAQMTGSIILPYNALSHRGKGAIRWWPIIDPEICDAEKRLAEALATMIHTYPCSWKRLPRFIANYGPEPRA